MSYLAVKVGQDMEKQSAYKGNEDYQISIIKEILPKRTGL
jgi:hypothetical protein